MQDIILTFDGVRVEANSTQLKTQDSDPRLTLRIISDFHDWLVETGLPAASADSYENGMKQIYKRLPKDKTIRRGTLQMVREMFQAEGYASTTINSYISAANSFLEYCGHCELQLRGVLPRGDVEHPELSRSEYLMLLSTARRLKKRREYLLIKLFATTGITISELPKLTPPAVRQGEIEVYQNRVHKIKPISSSLQAELLDYAEENGRTAGPIFISQSGATLHRRIITVSISALAEPAGLPKEKCNPTCLRKLYLTTRQEIVDTFEPMINKTYDDILDREQAFIGWNFGSKL
ncbi:MAG: hypothetical protein LUC19_02635 [Oscillospiraceae bacterium]|nr:hypothetical protein [Oscillospiraceae bacterium]MCD8373831.1 hypothetical protein [Oscillospiraceae bacterium]